MNFRMLILAFGLILSGCAVKQRAVPAFDDVEGFRSILCDLSPREDGGPDPSKFCNAIAHPNSDRYLFAMYFARYANYQRWVAPTNGYQPLPGAENVGAAIEAQRQWDAERKQKALERAAKNEREHAERRARYEAQRAQQQAEYEQARTATRERFMKEVNESRARYQAPSDPSEIEDCNERQHRAYDAAGGGVAGSQAVRAMPRCR